MDWNKKKDIAIVYDTTHKDHIYIAGVSESQYLNEKLNIWAYLSIQLPRRYEFCNSHSKDYLTVCDESIDWRHLTNKKGIPKLVSTLKPICSISHILWISKVRALLTDWETWFAFLTKNHACMGRVESQGKRNPLHVWGGWNHREKDTD